VTTLAFSLQIGAAFLFGAVLLMDAFLLLVAPARWAARVRDQNEELASRPRLHPARLLLVFAVWLLESRIRRFAAGLICLAIGVALIVVAGVGG
jgi:hypothetical protein